MGTSLFIIIIIAAVLVGFLAIGIILAKLYVRATKELAFVRTGLGGEKIIKDGGAIVFPVFNEVIPVNMNTLRIEVAKTQKDALITKDRMRVDVKADFYLRVAPNKEGISMAAQTLGKRTTHTDEVKKLMESKFVDVLRSVAAEMTMTEMHEQRSDFVQKVQQNVANDLEKNGLELESVSLTGFDQTDLQFFNESNAFDAEGRARLAKIIEEKRKETNDIEQENRILIEQRNLEAEKQSLEISKNAEEARLAQELTIESIRAEQKAEITKQREQKEKEEREAEIIKEKAIEVAEIEKAREIEIREIEKSKQLEQAKIQQQRDIEAAQIKKSREIETSEIEKKKTLEQARIQQQKDIEVASQEKQIAIAKKSEEGYTASAQAAEVEKQKVEKEEAVITAKFIAEANRRKEIEVIDARKEAEREAVGITVQAAASKRASEDKAEAILIEAKANSDAKKIQAEADEKVYAVDAEGRQALNEAENTLNNTQIELKKTMAILKVLPEIIANTVKPLENIEGIKILQGYGSSTETSGVGNGVASSGSMADQVTQAALNYRANAPVVDAMLRELGLVDSTHGSLHDLLNGQSNITTNMRKVISETPVSEPLKETEE